MSKYSTALSNGNKIHISYAERGSQNYKCCFCGNPMIAKKGNIKEHHFAHKADCSCDTWYGNKGPWHIKMQNLFPIEQQEVVKVVGDQKHIADVCIPKPSGNNLIIEFQDSPLSNEDFIERTKFWKENGDDIIWVFNVTDKDIRQIPDYPDYYRWYRPFTTLGKYHLQSVPIVFYMQPKINTVWKATTYNDYINKYNYVISGGHKCNTPFYFIDTECHSRPGGMYETTHLDGFSLLYSNNVKRSDESFLSYIKERLYISSVKSFVEYNPKGDVWIKFENRNAFEQYKGKLKHLKYVSDKNCCYGCWNIDVKIYLVKEKLYTCYGFYEFTDYRTRFSIIDAFGYDNVRIA